MPQSTSSITNIIDEILNHLNQITVETDGKSIVNLTDAYVKLGRLKDELRDEENG